LRQGWLGSVAGVARSRAGDTGRRGGCRTSEAGLVPPSIPTWPACVPSSERSWETPAALSPVAGLFHQPRGSHGFVLPGSNRCMQPCVWCAPEAERMLCWPTGGGWMDRRSIPVRCHVAVANIGPQLVTKTAPLLATVHRCSYTRFGTLLCLLLPQTQPHTHSIGCASRTGPEVSETFFFLGQGMSETFFSRTGNIIPPHRIVRRTH
jgi:hypothetical protein